MKTHTKWVYTWSVYPANVCKNFCYIIFSVKSLDFIISCSLSSQGITVEFVPMYPSILLFIYLLFII